MENLWGVGGIWGLSEGFTALGGEFLGEVIQVGNRWLRQFFEGRLHQPHLADKTPAVGAEHQVMTHHQAFTKT